MQHPITERSSRSSAPARRRALSQAKVQLGNSMRFVGQQCIQLHGGIGVTFEHDLHLYLRRVTLARALYGTPDAHRRHIARLIAHKEVAQ